ncbi:hypothetical protein BDZ94DRAFT_1303901 [Collybia nuda]|uniref:P-loop containing nucleoside triphosphate hydrolase protein n=1 Tax=Collybia nuda TaxID=64659 RepID=A0A9P6CKC6_9AGAR|nr:hypothetical protein BDZ94DRAFT_1303901 [Collybia nuda]
MARFLVAQSAAVTEELECIAFASSIVLALFIVVYLHPDSAISPHLITVLASSWMVYFFRNVVPLVMYNQHPADFPYMLWGLVSVLSFTAVLLPLITPYRYTPFDVSDPTPPSPEQTASPLSLLLFSFIDKMVWKAYREPHLPLVGLPPLADSDYTKNLVRTAFPHLDPHSNSSKLETKGNAVRLCKRSSQRRNILWAILFVFRKEAFGLKKLLEYLGNSGKGAIVRPWVWIALLFLVPFTATLMLQQYQKMLTRITVRLEAIFTQLILQHTLRMCIVTEGASEGPGFTSAPPSQAGESGRWEIISSSAIATANPTPTPPSGASTARTSVVGRMNNLITSDIQAVVQGAEFVQVFFAGPILITLPMCFLYTILGWSALAGFGVLILQIPLPTLLMRRLQGAARELGKKRDDRVEIVTESKILMALWMQRLLDAATVFSAIALFDILRQQTLRFFVLVPLVVKGQVSLRRIGVFWEDIGFRAATFSWSNDGTTDGAVPSKYRFRLQIDDELIFERGRVNLILGPTGSGKTSLLMALLGEMHFLHQESDSWFNLPRSGGVAYAAQETWITNNTIRPFPPVIYQYALNLDLEQFTAGDHTEVGKRGLTLSGGQKARITLARAVYLSAEILLLDDVSILAALNVHTAKWIVEKCFSGELIRGRTILLVCPTPQQDAQHQFGGPHIRFCHLPRVERSDSQSGYYLPCAPEKPQLTYDRRKGGSQRGKGGGRHSYSENKVQQEAEENLVLKEEVAEGHISWTSVKLYFVSLGGRHWILFWTLFTTAAFFERIVEVLQPWLLGDWATQYEEHSADKVNVSFYLGGYVGLAFLMLLVFSCNQITLAFGALRASSSLHRHLIDAVLGTTLRWFYLSSACAPISTHISPPTLLQPRCRQVPHSSPPPLLLTLASHTPVDTTLPDLFSHRFMAILIYTPAVGALRLAVFSAGAALGSVYMRSQLAVKREMSRAKAPVVAHFVAAVEGLVSIRAYGAQEAVLTQSLGKIDDYTRCARIFNDLTRWIGIRVDALGYLFAALLGWHFVYVPNRGVSTSNSAFTLAARTWEAIAVGFGRMVLIFVQAFNMFEVNGAPNPHPEPYTPGPPPAYWPLSGALHVENLSARYTLDGPDVLHDLTFTLRPGERIRVVGRTGSGKSTLALALLRCVLTRGEVYLDGLQTSALDLDAFRSRVTVVPQTPELLSGSVRRNLDPFEEFNDVALNEVLHDIGLYAAQEEDGEVPRGGSNLSAGQRQIIALARAIVRDAKLLILDKATSVIDYKTDAAIQASLRYLIKKDVMVITVAHRLHTIMDYDKIMVLDAGRIVEFGRPDELLRDDGKGRYFRILVDKSVDGDSLCAT